MATYYCAGCAQALGLKQGIDLSNLLGTTYQQDKFDKHTSTAPSTGDRVQSVFESRSTQYYADCICEAVEKGSVQIDDRQRKSIIFCPSTGSSIGSKYSWGHLASQTDTVVVVNTSEGAAIHSFTENSSYYSGDRCFNCGGPLF